MQETERTESGQIAVSCIRGFLVEFPYALVSGQSGKTTEAVYRLNFTVVDRSTRNKIAASDTHS
jgi:hypothetical protein